MILVVAFAAIFCGCERTKAVKTPIQIEPIIASRASALNFETGDEIGLRIERSSGIYADNAPMIYGGSSFVAYDLVWYDNEQEPSTLAAYYPYQAGAFPTEHTLPADQSNGITAADLLGAVRTQVTPSSSAVQMQFYHLMSRLVINITNQTDKAVSAVELTETVTTAVLDWTTPAASAKSGATASTIKAHPLTAGSSYEVVLVPQAATFNVVVATDSDKRYEKAVTAELLGGKSYTLSVTLLKDELAITLTGEIVDWSNGGDLDEGSDSNVPPIYQDGTITIGGESYATRAIGNRIWMAENVRYLPEGMSVGNGIWYPSGEKEKVATLGYLYNYETATTKNICPAGWHVPSGEELAMLIGADCGEGFFTPAGMCSISTDNIPSYKENSYLIGSTLEAEKCSVLLYTAERATEMKSIKATGGFSLRCIKDAD